MVASSIELSIPRMTLDVFGKAAIFCNSERKIMENWAFSWNRIMGSALDKINKKKNLRTIVWKGRRVKYNAKALRMVKRLSGNQVIY